MKKIILLMLCFTIGTLAVTAQTRALYPLTVTTTSYGNTLDTVVNTATKVTTVLSASSGTRGVTAQVVVKKISGTVGGSIGLYGSMDNVEWNLIGSASTPSDASANYSFNTTTAWRYYRISYAGTGTMSASFKTTFLAY